MTFSAALEIHQSDKLEAVQLLLQLYGSNIWLFI